MSQCLLWTFSHHHHLFRKLREIVTLHPCKNAGNRSPVCTPKARKVSLAPLCEPGMGNSALIVAKWDAISKNRGNPGCYQLKSELRYLRVKESYVYLSGFKATSNKNDLGLISTEKGLTDWLLRSPRSTWADTGEALSHQDHSQSHNTGPGGWEPCCLCHLTLAVPTGLMAPANPRPTPHPITVDTGVQRRLLLPPTWVPYSACFLCHSVQVQTWPGCVFPGTNVSCQVLTWLLKSLTLWGMPPKKASKAGQTKEWPTFSAKCFSYLLQLRLWSHTIIMVPCF